MRTVSEFNEFKRRLKSNKNRFQSWKIDYNIKWNQRYLSRGLNLGPGSNSLISGSSLYIELALISTKTNQGRFYFDRV